MKVVIITTGQPSINPRVVKEANALSAAGIQVTVLYCFWIQWADDADVILLKNASWNYHLIGGSPVKNRLRYLFTRARFRINSIVNKRAGNGLLLAERAQARCYDELLKKARSIKANWYLAHNLGALAIAVKAASFHKTQCGFDFEDYHRQENSNVPSFIQQRILYLENKYVPRLSYVSASSPLIAKQLRVDFPSFTRPMVIILNCFPLTSPGHSVSPAKDNLLQLFWFSQTVGVNRGLETVILALKKLNNSSIHLTLAGRCDAEMTRFINENAGGVTGNIHCAGIIDPGQLPAFAAGFDVGLASEIPFPLNRNICLTNKVFTYLVAGNCILASDTDAQKKFLNEHPGIGLLYKNDDVADLTLKIDFLYRDRRFLQDCKEKSGQLAKERMNWQTESVQLVKMLLSNEN